MKYLSILMCCFWLMACSSSSEDSTEKGFNEKWTPAYDSLVAYWDMSGSVAKDGSTLRSKRGDPGVLKNRNGSGMRNVGGPVGFALQFDGVDDYISVPYKNNLNWQSFSLALWVKVMGGTGLRSVLTSRDDTPARGYSLQLNNSNQVQLLLGLGSAAGQWAVVMGSTLSKNTWVHLAVTYDGHIAKIYQNGALSGSLVTSYRPNTLRPLYIAAGMTEAAPQASEFFNGAIDEVGIWQSALSESDVLSVYNKQTF